MPIRRAAYALAASAFLLATSGAALDLRALMATPFASGLTVSPDGRHIAWVLNRSGKRDVWVAEAPAWTARQATSFKDDDGMDVGELAWSPDSRTVIFTRAGEFGAARQPNPTSALEAPRSMLWTIAVSGGSGRALTEGGSGSFSPHDGRVWLLRAGQVFSIAPGGSEAKSEFKSPGAVSDLTWSPDGRQLAFRSDRGTHSFIGVFTAGSTHLRYLEASVDTDSSPIWSPDGRQIAFLREPAATALALDAARREGSPWSIRITDLQTNATRELFRAAPGIGSVHRDWASTKQLLWSSSNDICFGWERTGWLHLYTIAASGGIARERTAGKGEINDVSLSHDGRFLTYSSNIGDIERPHIAGLALGEHEPRTITTGSGAEWSPITVSGADSVVFLASSYNTASHVELATAKSRRPLGESAIAADLIEPEPVLFNSTDGVTVHAQLFRRSGANRRPAIVFVHGGPRRQMLLEFHPMYYYSNAYELNQYLASAGYVVLSINYRSGIGYGMQFREARNYGPAGGSEYDDVKAAAQYLKTRDDVDPLRIGIWGGSWGGYLTALALARDSSTFKAGVDFHGVHDWRFEMEPGAETPERSEFERQALAASPLASMDAWRSPVLVIHGDDDRTVPFIQTVRLVEELRRHDVPFEELIFPGEIHDMLVWENWLEAYTRAAVFFEHIFKTPAVAH